MVKSKINWSVALLVILLVSACNKTIPTAAPYEVVPLPQEITLSEDAPFVLDQSVVIAYPAADTLLARNAAFLAEYIEKSLGNKLKITPLQGDESGAAKGITLALNSDIREEEGYVLTVTQQGITIEGSTPQGVFYGIQTLRKSLPSEAKGSASLPAGKVVDAPRFGYRGMHLDVCRHFFPVEFIKEYIDILALHNMNTFHWHLTEDQGWRIEIEKYPRLTEVGAWRDRTVVGYAGSGEYDSVHYGGFYTKEELREVVRYAQERYITIIPEVDMPGHMLAALAAYPELGCTGGPYEVCPDWGVFEDVLCIGNEKTFEFLEAVFEEIMEIFPSKYIHIGGDECPRVKWHDCPKCQARIKAEGLKAANGFSVEDALQSYTTRRIEKFLNAHGRSIIGWDEILNGEIAPNATVMSWQGSAGGIKAAKMGHNVIMTPNSHCYFDYYQTPHTEDEPLSIGGCLTVEKVYSLDPTAQLSPEQSKYVLGVQANVWTEYIHTPEHVEYMILPRMAALCEVQWCAPEKKNYKAFTGRVPNLMKLYEKEGYNYAKHIYELFGGKSVDLTSKVINVNLNTIDNAQIYYTLDGSTPQKSSHKYDGSIVIDKSAQLRAVAIRPSGRTNEFTYSFDFNKATLSKVEFLTTQPHPNYTFDGAVLLVDGVRGSDNFASGEWLGFVGDDVTARVDLGEAAEVSSFAVRALTYLDAWIMAPTALQVSTSVDGENYTIVGEKEYPYDNDVRRHTIDTYSVEFAPREARYIVMTLKSSGTLPKGHAAAGSSCFLFIDEIEVK